MTDQNVNFFNNTEAARIIAKLRNSTGEPTAADWKRLIEENPELAGDIADAAMLRRGVQHLDDSAFDAPLNRDVYASTVSQAINLLHQTPSLQLLAVQDKVAAVRGPAVRKLAQDIGLASYPALLSGVLAGSIEAPSRVLANLSERFETSAAALLECFRRTFALTTVPSYKAEGGKPGITARATPWADAVRSLHLSDSDTRELLSLDE